MGVYDLIDSAAKNQGISQSELMISSFFFNRYDLLCIEGLSRALVQYIHSTLSSTALPAPPTYRVSTPSNPQVVHVHSSVSPLRPFFASAVLRLAKPLTQEAYDSFIDLQDKLHQNLCRQRKLVAIGTHDLDSVQGPFRYECKDPKSIRFAPLNKQVEYTAEELMGVYEVCLRYLFSEHMGKGGGWG